MHNSVRIFIFFLMPNWMNHADLEGLQDKQSTKIQGHYEVSTNDFPFNFSSIFNKLRRWYEKGLKTYQVSEKQIRIKINQKRT